MVVPLRTVTVSFVCSLLLLLAVTPTPAQVTSNNICDNPNIGCCGDLTLVLLNPDIAPGSDGFIRASGNLFLQFQAIGAAAGDIETFGFSFGAQTQQFPDDVCDLPPEAWFTGQQILNYRADTNPDDGFFINLQTGLVPDGQYTAAVHAFDGADKELARFWASAIVSNCDTAVDPAGAVERCGDDAEQMRNNDATMPWPIVLPGDGLTVDDVDGFTVEFAEELSEYRAFINGEEVTDQLQPYEGRLWDNDYFPGYGPLGLGGIVAPECSQTPPQDCQHLGVAYQWTERKLTQDDVVRIEAVDLNGNVASKDLHIGAGVTSGAITEEIPILTWSVDEARQELEATKTAVFRFTIQNSGGETGHPFADQKIPDGWAFEWQPVHTPVASGNTEDQEFLITPPAGTTPGDYPIIAMMNYTQGGTPKTLRQDLTVTVLDGGLAGDSDDETLGAEDVGSDDKGSPGVSAGLALGLLAVAVAARRRRSA